MIYDEVITDAVSYPYPISVVDLGSCVETIPCPKTGKVKKKEGNKPMYDNNQTIDVTDKNVTAQRDHLKRRLNAIKTNLWNVLREKFGAYRPNKPGNVFDLVSAIKDGKYTIDKKMLKLYETDKEAYEDYYGINAGTFYGIKFTDYPGFDADGFLKAENTLNKTFQDTLDQILILDPKDGLAALKAFELQNAPSTDTVQ